MKIRLVKVTNQSGEVVYLLEEKMLFWWVYMGGTTRTNLDEAKRLFTKYVDALGETKREVIQTW